MCDGTITDVHIKFCLKIYGNIVHVAFLFYLRISCTLSTKTCCLYCPDNEKLLFLAHLSHHQNL